MIINAAFTSVWNDNIAVVTECKVNTETREVFDIQPDDSPLIEMLNSLEREYITIDSVDYGVYIKDDAGEGDYWYYGSDDESLSIKSELF